MPVSWPGPLRKEAWEDEGRHFKGCLKGSDSDAALTSKARALVSGEWIAGSGGGVGATCRVAGHLLLQSFRDRHFSWHLCFPNGKMEI